MDFDELLPDIAAGDTAAFSVFVGGSEELVRLSLRSFARSIDTEAVLQEAYLRVWQVAQNIVQDANGQSLLRFTFRVAKNLALNEARRRREVLPDDLEDQDIITEDGPPTVDVLLRDRIRECFEKLPQKPKEAMEARLRSDGSANDRSLAALCHMEPNTFLQNITRARRLIRECLERFGVPVGGAK